MAEPAYRIDLSLPEKLQDPRYRKEFFWAQASAEIAEGLVRLRKRRQLNQKEVAEMIGTKQPAISRVEQADYQNWNLNTLRSISEALDARLRVIIEPYEDVISEYNTVEELTGNQSFVSHDSTSSWDSPGLQINVDLYRNSIVAITQFSGPTTSALSTVIHPNIANAPPNQKTTHGLRSPTVAELTKLVAEKDMIIAEKDKKIEALKNKLVEPIQPSGLNSLFGDRNFTLFAAKPRLPFGSGVNTIGEMALQ